MATTKERRRDYPALPPREAAFVTGLSEKTINQAIDRDEVRTVPARRKGDRERRLNLPELLYLRLRGAVGPLLSPEGKRLLREQLGRSVGARPDPTVVQIGPVQVQVATTLLELKSRIAELEEARSTVASDPAVHGGEPVVRGTRIPVHMLADLVRQGAGEEELLEDYPSLTPDSLQAALLYVRMHPKRGRPRRTPWKDGTVLRKGG